MTLFAVVWEFRVRPGQESAFEAAYGPKGAWVQLLAQAEGYVGTELLRDAATTRRYLTVDRWASPALRKRFLAAFGAEYAALDEACEALTQAETLVGEFDCTWVDNRN